MSQFRQGEKSFGAREFRASEEHRILTQIHCKKSGNQGARGPTARDKQRDLAGLIQAGGKIKSQGVTTREKQS